MRRLFPLAILVIAAASLLLAAGASAQTVETHALASSFNGHDANGAKAFEAESLEKIAIDDATETVYVGGKNYIYKFNSSGVSQPFSAMAPETVIKEGVSTSIYTVGDLAVDNTGGPDQSRIYAFSSGEPIRAYEPSGSQLTGGGFPMANTFNACGLAMETNGDFWLRSNDGPAVQYEPDGTPTGSEVEFEGFNFSCAIAVDGAGNFYIPQYSNGGAVDKYDSSGHLVQRIDGSGAQTGFAVDTSNGQLYVATKNTINQYSPSGELLDSFGTLQEPTAVAVDPVNHDVYVLDYGPPAVVQKFTPSGTTITVPDVTTEPISELTRVGAKLHGTLKPDGSPITGCVFEWGHAEYGGFTETSPCAEGNSFAAETAVSAVIESAEPNTEYEYRLRVTNGDGPGYGKIQTFKTPVAIKDITTEPATGVDFSHATLHGSLDPEGIETEYWFEYGPGYSLETESPHITVSSSGTLNAELPLSALEAGTSAQGQEFGFRITAENYAGRTYGEFLTFTLPPAVKGVATGTVDELSLTSATFHGSFEPQGTETHYYFEYGATASYGGYAPVPPPGEVASGSGVENVSAHVTGLPEGSIVHYRIVAVNSTGKTAGEDAAVRLGEAPTISADRANEVNTDTTVLEAVINPNNRETTYHWEYGLEDCETTVCQQTEPQTIPSGGTGVPIRHTLEGLTPGATYHFRLVAENALGSSHSEDHFFITFAPESGVDTCPNVLERKQTGAAATAHCRAYELVSAANTGGYDVESNLIAGLEPLPGFPNADGKVLYSVRYGAIPGSGNPTNKGGDPYLATRGPNGWTTEYVGMQANGSLSAVPFASTVLEADQQLGAVAFGGPELCSPCFEDGSRNIPLRIGSGPIEKGMVGSENPAAEPAGEIAKTFSADGDDLIFGSTARFEPSGNEGSLSIYERDLAAGATQVVSTMPDGSTMPGSGTAELDVSADGSRVLVGRQVGTDAAGNPYYDLYMHVGDDPHSVLVADPPDGVLYAGMSADGSKVYFTTPDALGDDTDSSADLFRADVTATGATVTRVSTGSGGSGNSDLCHPVSNSDGNHWNEPGSSSAATCGVVAIGGGGGVASESGTVYFLSPENLESGSGAVADQPNLYSAQPGSQPQFVATLDPDDAVVRDAVAAAGERNSADFQTTSDGGFATFVSRTSLTPSNNAGHDEIYRSEAGGALACVSCIPSNAAPSSDTELTENGLNLVEDGRVFFTTKEQLVLRDTNRLEDAYEWDEGHVSLISTGLDSNDSGLLTASADGKDAFFFTRQTLAPQDENGGAMKIYDAREDGGFLFNPPPRPCVASDECHGPGTQQAPPPAINTIEGTGEPQPPIGKAKKPVKCHKGQVKRQGKCVKKNQKKGKQSKKKAGRHGRGKERQHG
jgi:hypothetical protein